VSSSRVTAPRVALATCASGLVFWLILRFIGQSGQGPSRAELKLPWALAAVFLLTLQIAVVTLRWVFFSRELGARLRYPAALGAYYVSILLNQLLPLGMLGDAVRGLWHARRLAADPALERPARDAATALILDRVSGQLTLLALALPVLPLWWQPVRDALRASTSKLGPIAALSGLLVAAALGTLLSYVGRSALAHTARARQLFFRPRALAVHAGYSALAVFLHIAAFSCTARALGFAFPLGLAARVVPFVLLVSALPSFAFGTGLREASAAALYRLLGLHPAEGAAIALGLGLLGFAASLPGLLLLALALGRRRAAQP
jgi:uncharacterized membrane protein YbhN (UPF0104 family)